MAESAAPQTLTTPTGTILFNQDITVAGVANCMYWVENTEGLDDAPVRAPQEDRPRTPGGIIHDILDGARHITIEGYLYIGPDTAYNQVVARNTMERDLRLVLRGARTADGSYSYSPTGLGTDVYTIRNDVPVTYPGKMPKRFIFGMVAGDPTAG